MSKWELLLEEQKRKLQKALAHLDYSYTRIEHLPLEPEKLDESQLADWEAYSARFSRVVELFLGRYLKTRVLKEDPGYEGSLRDHVHQAEKLGILEHAETWMTLRELRNITAHEYSESDLKNYFSALRLEYKTLKSIRL